MADETHTLQVSIHAPGVLSQVLDGVQLPIIRDVADLLSEDFEPVTVRMPRLMLNNLRARLALGQTYTVQMTVTLTVNPPEGE